MMVTFCHRLGWRLLRLYRDRYANIQLEAIVGDTVRLRHQSYAELLRGSHFTVPSDIHLHLLARCIEYLELMGGQ